MLPAIGAASLALDTIQSLTSPQPAASQPIGFGPPLSDGEDSSAASQATSAATSRFSLVQISSDNLNALLGAQSRASANFAQALDSDSQTSDSSSTPSNSASGTASSTYGAVDQLLQSTAVPLGFNPFSVSA